LGKGWYNIEDGEDKKGKIAQCSSLNVKIRLVPLFFGKSYNLITISKIMNLRKAIFSGQIMILLNHNQVVTRLSVFGDNAIVRLNAFCENILFLKPVYHSPGKFQAGMCGPEFTSTDYQCMHPVRIPQ
jgi:hypothetical protein